MKLAFRAWLAAAVTAVTLAAQPAAGWLLIAGLGGLVALRRRG